MIQILNKYTLVCLCLTSIISTAWTQQERSKIAESAKWNVYDLYSSEAEWSNRKAHLEQKSNEVARFKGTLTQSGTQLLEYLQWSDTLYKEASRLSLFASLLADTDLRDAENQARQKEIRQFYVDFGQKASFVSPELATLTNAQLDQFIKKVPALETYRMPLENTIRMKAHTLSDPEEQLMALTGLTSGTANSAYSVFTNAEMPWTTVTLSNGTSIELNRTEFSKFRASANRSDRELVSKAYWEQMQKFEGTLGELLNGQLKQDLFRAQARHYASTLDAALKPNHIPESVYHALLENVSRNLPTFHRYLDLKRRIMGLDTLRYADLYAPAVEDVQLQYSYEEAQKLILESLQPLGKTYTEVVQQAFENQWIDVYPNKGKRSGAYSNGAAYEVHPYILMNYNNQYNEVSTLTHELGHTMHSYFSNHAQPFATARYVTFVAEVASTYNEVLLNDMMQKKLQDDKQKLSLLMSMLDGFKGTLFRQTQFAEFELRIHEAVAAGTPLTGKALSKIYLYIARKYYGSDKGICQVPDYIGIEWAAVPHFYRSFYVFQYSTSFVASQALANQLLAGKTNASERFIQFLSAGGSNFPIEILKNTGVDMTRPEPFEATIVTMNHLMDEMELLLNRINKQ